MVASGQWSVVSESEGRELAVRAEASKKAPKQSQIALALVFDWFALKTCHGEIELENEPNRHTLTEKPVERKADEMPRPTIGRAIHSTRGPMYFVSESVTR